MGYVLPLKWSSLENKTIDYIDEKFGDNVIVLNFKDKTSVVIDTDAIGYGLYRPILFSLTDYQRKD